MRLRHCRFSAIEDVVYQLFTIWQLPVLAIDVLHAFLIDQEQMIPARPSSNVDVFSKLHVALSTQNRQPPITPRRQTIRRKPVHSNVAHASIASEHCVAEVLESWRVRVVHVAYLRCNNFSSC